MEYEAALFDLDGVLVDTAKLHFLAWQGIAEALGIPFTERDNERLKGVGRMESLEIILSLGKRRLPMEEKTALCGQKNAEYVKLLQGLRPRDTLPGARETLKHLRGRGCKIGLGSASRNAALVLEKTQLLPCFDVVVDGNTVAESKPDPRVFTVGADALGTPWPRCCVFEDSAVGVQAAKAAGMHCVGIGRPKVLQGADLVVQDLAEYLKHLQAGGA